MTEVQSAQPQPPHMRRRSSSMQDIQKRLVTGVGGLRMIAQEDEDASPFTLEEPRWMDDMSLNMCSYCKSSFGIFNRRHHCRRCGVLLCSSCCDTLMPLPRLGYVDPARVCVKCIPTASRESEFFDRHLKLLLKGSFFRAHRDGKTGIVKMVLLPNQRYLKVEDAESGEPNFKCLIAVDRISEVQDVRKEPDGAGVRIQTFIIVGDNTNLELEAKTRDERVSFTAALREALRLLPRA
eukprot:Opistho-2@42816